NLDEYIVPTEVLGDDNLEDIMNNLLDYAYEKNILESNTSVYRDLLDTKIMSLLIPRPSEVTKEFNKRYKKDKVCATDYLYNLSKSCDYVRTNRIAQN
ncbi:galactose-1-phosphate uridylyltransferase, partial [Paeniclostridium sordellii]|nr:galactose-1-phosphate uridylyltransferase [Paeniclostridium sordellii]